MISLLKSHLEKEMLKIMFEEDVEIRFLVSSAVASDILKGYDKFKRKELCADFN